MILNKFKKTYQSSGKVLIKFFYHAFKHTTEKPLTHVCMLLANVKKKSLKIDLPGAFSQTNSLLLLQSSSFHFPSDINTSAQFSRFPAQPLVDGSPGRQFVYCTGNLSIHWKPAINKQESNAGPIYHRHMFENCLTLKEHIKVKSMNFTSKWYSTFSQKRSHFIYSLSWFH